MSSRPETGAPRDGTHEVVEAALIGPGDRDVLHRAAVGAHQVVVVPREPLGRLVTRDAAGAVMRDEHPRLLQDRERSIERRERDGTA